MLSNDVKAKGKHQEIKELATLSCNFLLEVPSKLER